MNVNRLLNQTCTLTLVTPGAGAADGMGDPTDTTTTATFRCWLSQATSARTGAEITRNENVQSQSLDLYLEPAAAALDGYDRVTVDGVTYEVDGPPIVERNPRTLVVEYVVASVRRTR